MLFVLCSPLPPHWVELTGAVTAESHYHRSTRTRILQYLFDATKLIRSAKLFASLLGGIP